MAFMRMMGADSVRYHEETVLGRSDDFAGQTLDYYGSRGETPMRWGGAGARRLGLAGEVTPEQYAAAFGPGGFIDPVTGARLVRSQRPGMELVVAAHKSVAVLGVIGRADDMHAILDAETAATMAFLDAWFQERGGRRGREQVRTATSGLTWCATRHATSRAGDPAPHDHVLVANVVEMLDQRGGWKALDTASLRDVLHAATIVGRAAAAHTAVELGYAIEPDDGPSGSLRHWRIAGVPDEVCWVLSKRTSEIDDFVDDRRFSGYRARSRAARATRRSKAHDSPDQLIELWRADLDRLGWPPARLLEAVIQAPRISRRAPTADEIASVVLGPESMLAARKVLSRRDLLVEVGPSCYGLAPDALEALVDQLLASEHLVPLLTTAGAREPAYAPTRVLAVEQAIADRMAALAVERGPVLDAEATAAAIGAKEAELGHALTAGQGHAVRAICTSGRRFELVVGVAGAGKTTAIDAAAAAFRAAGMRVLGTSTSGQAARTLGRAADIESRTLASMLWRLDQGSLRLDPRTVVVLDEAAMTADEGLLRLVAAIDTARAKLVLVGDPRQLGAVGPGGAMAALLQRHPEAVSHLRENVRQQDPLERHALDALRSGDVEVALGWYRRHDRICSSVDLDQTINDMVERWDHDVAAGLDTTLLAWRRDHVAELNRRARLAALHAGRVRGPEVRTRDGRRFAAGDPILVLAPNPRLGLVTSQRLDVVAVDETAQAITVRTAEGPTVELGGEDLGPDRIDLAYATTIHRAQGATVDTCHVWADGLSNQLAYVALSRARLQTTAYTVADDVDQAVEDLASDWARQDQQRWIIDDRPTSRDRTRAPLRASEKLQRGRLHAEAEAVRALLQATDLGQRIGLEIERHRLHTQRQELLAGTGPWADSPAGVAARRLDQVARAIQKARRTTQDPRASRRSRRGARVQLTALLAERDEALAAWDAHGAPIAEQLGRDIEALDNQIGDVPDASQQAVAHQTLVRRLEHLERQLQPPTPLGRPGPALER